MGRRRQYALPTRARALGWEKVVVIDDDLGRSGGGTARPGFERLSKPVTRRRGHTGKYDAVDPDNRLVASDLERRWNEKLGEMARLKEMRVAKATQAPALTEAEDARLLRVRNFRGTHRIADYREGERATRHELILHVAARRLGVSKMTVLRLIRVECCRQGRSAWARPMLSQKRLSIGRQSGRRSRTAAQYHASRDNKPALSMR